MSEQRPDRPTPKRNKPGIGNGGMKFGRGLLGWLLFVAVAALLFVWLKQANPTFATISLTDFYREVKSGNVEKMTIEEADVEGKFKTDRVIGSQKVSNFHVNIPPMLNGQWEFVKNLLDPSDKTTEIKAEQTNSFLMTYLLPFIPWLLILGVHLVLRLPPTSQQRRRRRNARKLWQEPARRSRARNTPTSPSTMWPASKRPRKR